MKKELLCLLIVLEIVFAGCKKAVLPTMETTSPSDLTMTQVVIGGLITSDGGDKIIERGICWGRDINPFLDANIIKAGQDGDSFTCTITGLEPSTTYYARAYAINNQGVGYGNQIGFITLADNGGDPNAFPMVETSPVRDITATNALGSGVVTATGGSVVLERGVCWSTQTNPIVSGNHAVAGSGAGTFSCVMMDLEPNTTYYVRAYAINNMGIGYGNEVNFTTLSGSGGGNTLEGVIGGAFSISSSHKVYFSKGNLQYQPSTGIWRFADKQYSLIHVSGDMTEEINIFGYYCNVSNEYVPSYSGWIDFFGWGTSGWNNGNVYYRPYDWQRTNDIETGWGYGPTNGTNYELDLTGAYANADWGVYNALSNGGNQSGLWRTLSMSEWTYLLATRNASIVNGVANARFAKGKVAGVYGLILFPDNYSHPSTITLPVGINARDDFGWNNNSYNVSEWEEIENAGAVFLPAAGYRWRETQVVNINESICYWSTTNCLVTDDHSLRALMLSVYNNDCYYGGVALSRTCGCSVRLVQDAHP